MLSKIHPWSALLYGFVLLYPLLIFPADQSDLVWTGARVLALLLFGVVTLLHLKARYLTRLFPMLLLGHGVFVVASTLVARHPDGWALSVMGSDTRNDALLYQLGLVLLGLFAHQLFVRRSANARPLFTVLLLGGGLQALVVTLQYYGHDPIYVVSGYEPFNRLSGTLGHPGYVAGFLVVAALSGLGLLAQDKNGYRRALIAAALVAVAAGLGIANNRAAFYALALALIPFNLLQRQFAVAGLSLLILIVAAQARSALPPGIFTQSRSVVNTDTLKTRFEIWRLGLGVLGDIPGQPLVGGGSEAFKRALTESTPIEALYPLFRMEYNWPPSQDVLEAAPLHQAGQPITSARYLFTFGENGVPTEQAIYPINLDRAHNLFLDRVLAYGFIDAALWALLLGAPILWGVRARSTAARTLGCAVLALFIYYQAWFPAAQLEPVHLVVIAAAWALHARGKDAAGVAPIPGF